MTSEPSWTMSQLRWVLEHLPELLLSVHPGSSDLPRRRKRKRRAPPFAFAAAELLADIELAMQRLREENEELFEALRATYFDPAYWQSSRSVRISLWALGQGRSYTTGWRCCRRAEKRLLAILNGIDVDAIDDRLEQTQSRE
ncbi:hypothetical protein [Thermomicrobium sp.]